MHDLVRFRLRFLPSILTGQISFALSLLNSTRMEVVARIGVRQLRLLM